MDDDDRPDVLLTGLLFFDLVLTGLGQPPTPGEEIWTGGMGCGPGGIANLAVATARFGLRTSLATVFGDDLYGEYCRDILCDQEDIDLSLSRTADGWPTPVTVSLAYDHDRALVTHGQEPPYSQDALMGDPPEARTALVHIEAEPREWLAKAAANGTQIYADVGWDPTQQWSTDLLDQLSLCHAFLPNETEAMAYTRTDSAVAALGTLSRAGPGGRGHTRRGRRRRRRPDDRRVRGGTRPGHRRRSTRRAPGTCSGRASSRPRWAAGRWRNGSGSPYWPPACRSSGTAGPWPRPAGTASTAGGAP